MFGERVPFARSLMVAVFANGWNPRLRWLYHSLAYQRGLIVPPSKRLRGPPASNASWIPVVLRSCCAFLFSGGLVGCRRLRLRQFISEDRCDDGEAPRGV